MEVLLLGSEGLPEGAVLSLKWGDMKRQAPVSQVGQHFRFNDSAAHPMQMKVEVLTPMAPAQSVPIDPAQDVFEVAFDSRMKVRLQHRPAKESQRQVVDIKSADGKGLPANNDWERARWEGEALMRKARGQDAWRPRYVIDCVVWPLLLFCHIYYWSFGGWRYRDWRLAMCLAFLGVAVCVGSTWVTLLMFRRQVPSRRWIALSACLWLACFGGLWAGDQNYGHHMISFYTYQDLVSYTDLDPAVAKGQSFMDSGEVYFKEGTTVDTNEMVSFRNRLNFCAAPILGQPLRNQKGLHEVAREGDFVMPESGTVDFWAVGTNCCDKATREFTCGEASNKRARAGMRMIREDHRPFYLLAIQEWTARMCPTSGEDNTAKGHSKAAPLLCIPSRHPLLFTWVEDPVGEVTKYYEQALWRFEMDVVVFLMMDIFIALGALLGLKELGFK